MPLRSDAVELSEVLNEVLRGLREYEADARSSYTQAAARQLEPLVKAFDEAVLLRQSREGAAEVLAALRIEMHSLNAAKTKGEINFVSDTIINRYWELQSIFQESRYRGQSL